MQAVARGGHTDGIAAHSADGQPAVPDQPVGRGQCRMCGSTGATPDKRQL
jgi:hypothetical protein